MKLTLRLEELAMFLASIGLLYMADVSWWWYLLLLIGPDVSMIGYLAGNSTGAWLYNLFHHKGFGILLTGIGMILFFQGSFLTSNPNIEWVIFTGIVIFGHSSMDRFFGYGLKYKQGFKYTHLGVIGKSEKRDDINNALKNENL